MRKIRLGLDIDGVLYRWQDTAIYLLNTHRGTSLSYDAWNHWDYLKETISKEDWKWLWTKAIVDHGLFRYGSIYKGSREFLVNMQEYCDTVILTSRPADAVRDTMEWLSYQRVPTAEVHIIGHGRLKSDIVPHCDLYIDDAEHNTWDLLQHTEGNVILPDRPWNRDIGETLGISRFERAYSWDQIEEIIRLNYDELNLGT